VQASGDTPSPRSGHRLVGLQQSLLLFGGFAEASRSSK